MCNEENAHGNPFKNIRHTDEHLGEEKARVHRSTVVRLNYSAADRPDLARCEIVF